MRQANSRVLGRDRSALVRQLDAGQRPLGHHEEPEEFLPRAYWFLCADDHAGSCPFGDLCRFVRSSRQPEAAEDRRAKEGQTAAVERERRLPRRLERLLPGNVGNAHGSRQAILVKILLQMDQNGGW